MVLCGISCTDIQTEFNKFMFLINSGVIQIGLIFPLNLRFLATVEINLFSNLKLRQNKKKWKPIQSSGNGIYYSQRT